MVSIFENTATWIDRTIEAMKKKCQKTILQFQTEKKKQKTAATNLQPQTCDIHASMNGQTSVINLFNLD